ncbi:MAG TPA: Fur family transcriptional regulator [Acidimicrobiales bacterium]
MSRNRIADAVERATDPAAAAHLAAILERLRHDGGRVTATRRLVIDAMLGSHDHHLTAADVVEAVRRDEPDFHPSTVYRTLDRLTELGVVDRIQIGPGPAVYHLSHRPHRHLVCDGCGAVREAPPDVLDAVATRLATETGFALNPGATPLHGLCEACTI